jgi:hypothetical protein
MLVTTRGLQTEEGFISPNLTIDPAGNITATSINVASISVDGEVLFGAGAPGDEGGGGPITNLAPSIVNSSLKTFGIVTSLTVAGNTTISNGLVQIISSPTGTINNVDIGGATPGNGTFVTLSATNGTITTLNSTTATLGTASATTVTSNTVVLTSAPTALNHATTKSYVDTQITALSIALGM